MKNSNASILLEKYQTEKRKRILRYSSRPTNANISTLSTNVQSKLGSSKLSSNVDNFEFSFMLSSIKSMSTPSQQQCGYHIDGADRFQSSKENKAPKTELKRLLAKTQNVIVHRVPEKLATRYFNMMKNGSKDVVKKAEVVDDEKQHQLADDSPFETPSNKKSLNKFKQEEDAQNEAEQKSGPKLESNPRRNQINSVHESENDDVNGIPKTLCYSDIENTPIKKKRGNQIGGNRTSLLISVDNPFGNLQQFANESVNEALPFTMKEFPEDVSPAEFFQQKQSAYHSYIESMRKTIAFATSLSLYHFHKDFNVFFSPFTIHTKSSKGVATKSHFNLSASYFLVNCSEVVQLYFAFEMIMFYLTSKKQIPLFITHKDFDRVLSKLSGEVDFTARMSILSKKSFQRKSMFSNKKVNFVIEDFDDNTDSPQKSDPQKDQANGQDNQLTITPFQINGLPSHELAQVKEVGGELSGSDSDSDSKSHNSSSSNSDSDSDNSDSDSSSDSLDETEYSTKNPFVLKYSKIVHKFQTYEVKVTPAVVSDADGQTEKLTPEMIYDLLYDFNDFNFDFFVQ